MKRQLLTALFFVCAVAATSSPAHAWSRFHPGWKLPVTYSFSTPSKDLGENASEQVIARAVVDWMNVRCTSLRTQYAGRTTRQPGARDGQNVFGWVHSGWSSGTGVIGTTTYRSTSAGAESDIAFNGQDYVWTEGPGRGRTVNAYSIVSHELGHFFGLGHSEVRGAVMYASYGGGTLALGEDDERGICALYPGGKSDCRGVSCPNGFSCVAGRCEEVPQAPITLRRVCAECATHEDCGSSVDACLRYPDGRSYCGRSCTSDAECGASTRCLTMEGFGRQCVRFVEEEASCASVPMPAEGDGEPSVETPGTARLALGSRCDDNEQCATGICGERSGSTFCTSACASEESCPQGFVCEANGDGAFCVSSDLAAADCTAGECAEKSGGGCSATGSRETSWPLGLWLAVGIVFSLRRRRTLQERSSS